MKFKMLLFFVSVLLYSCSSDNADMDEPSIVGEWELFSVTAPQPIDLNQDGKPTTQLLKELPCFNDIVNIHEDGTFTRIATALEVTPLQDPPGISASCLEATITTVGQWELEGDALTFTIDGRTQTTTISLTFATLAFTDINPVFGPLDLVFIRK